MEADIITEGFAASMEMHGLKYTKLIGDGDSSVYSKLMIRKPYRDEVITKIECKNHLLRNYCHKLTELTTKKVSTKNTPVPYQQRQRLRKSIMRLRTAIDRAIIYHGNSNENFCDQIRHLAEDVRNSPHHVFGNQDKCAHYFCSGTTVHESNYVAEMEESGLFQDILACGARLVKNAQSLILNMTNNEAERYNAIVCKFVGGKRINYSTKNSYGLRCNAAAVSFNANRDANDSYYSQIHKAVTLTSPGKYTKKFEKKIKNKKIQNNIRRRLFVKPKKKEDISASGQRLRLY